MPYKDKEAFKKYLREWRWRHREWDLLRKRKMRERYRGYKCPDCGIPLTEEDGETRCINCAWKSHHPFARQIKGGSYATYLKRIAQRP